MRQRGRDSASEVVGVVPAAGRATRLHQLPCSKEIYPITFAPPPGEPAAPARPKAVCEYLLESMRLAGASQAYLVLGHGKWDIAAYLGDGASLGMDLAYLTIDESPGTPYTVDRAHAFVRDRLVVFGFPDIVFQPQDAFVRLLERQRQTSADAVLGLFDAQAPQRVDMVRADSSGRVVEIVIKPASTDLQHAWLVAVWTPGFTEFLHEQVGARYDPAARERFVGDVVQAAVEAGLHVDTLAFEDGRYRDIGTPEDLLSALREAR